MMLFQIRFQFWIDWPIHKKTNYIWALKNYLHYIYNVCCALAFQNFICLSRYQCLLCFGFSKLCMSLKVLENFRYQLWLWEDYELQSSFKCAVVFIHFLTFWVCVWAVTFCSLWLYYRSTCCKMEMSTCIYFHFFMMEREECGKSTAIYYFY